ncbi:MAG: pteridine reductase [Xanthomonadales bacterium]|nr:pteridine reductase [Xanthomonadales bacterium]
MTQHFDTTATDCPSSSKPDPAQVALVTGAAKRIGARISRHLHQRGLRVAIHCRHANEEAQQLAQELNSQRAHSALIVHSDLNDLNQLQQLPDQIIQHWGRLDILVNNASSFFPTPVGKVTATQWDDLFGSNVRGPFFLSQAAAPYLRQQQGALINIVDIHASKPLAEHSLYCMAKASLLMMTQSLAKELAPEVRVNAVAPGYILRPPDDFPDHIHDTIVQRTALKRQGDPQDIAQTVAFLALDAPFISGQVIAVDGGRSLHM